MSFLEKLKSLPVWQKKIILWSVVATLALVLFILWVKNVREELEGFPGEKLREQFELPKFPSIEIPEIRLPEIPEDELKKLEKELDSEKLEELKKLYDE